MPEPEWDECEWASESCAVPPEPAELSAREASRLASLTPAARAAIARVLARLPDPLPPAAAAARRRWRPMAAPQGGGGVAWAPRPVARVRYTGCAGGQSRRDAATSRRATR